MTALRVFDLEWENLFLLHWVNDCTESVLPWVREPLPPALSEWLHWECLTLSERTSSSCTEWMTALGVSDLEWENLFLLHWVNDCTESVLPWVREPLPPALSEWLHWECLTLSERTSSSCTEWMTALRVSYLEWENLFLLHWVNDCTGSVWPWVREPLPPALSDWLHWECLTLSERTSSSCTEWMGTCCNSGFSSQYSSFSGRLLN